MVKKASRLFLCFCTFLIWHSSVSLCQENSVRWFNPLEEKGFVVLGQAWERTLLQNPFSRLPFSAKDKVRPRVWDLSQNAAGISINFVTDATAVTIRYGVKGKLAMNHMPATAVSGVDLYAFDKEYSPIWCRSTRYVFGDSITFQYTGLQEIPEMMNGFKRYQLYLPLYNSVEWLEIGLQGGIVMDYPVDQKHAPIVVYGTSKTQGACVSRPGLAWTSILQRAIDLPVVNLGFSDNGRMEPGLIDMIAQVNASVYVIDCLGNMLNEGDFPNKVIEQRIRGAYQRLRQENPDVPILFTQHPGLSDEVYNSEIKRRVDRVNALLIDVISRINKEGASRLYMLSKEELGICQECTVDGTHPTDQGMRNYALGYENKIRMIFEDMGVTHLKSNK